jgi:hypothetical protein
MKILQLFVACLISCLVCLPSTGQTNKELKSRKIKVVTATEETFITTKVLLSDSALIFTGDQKIDSLNYSEIVYIYVKEGSNFPQVMAYSISFGLSYGVVMGLLYSSFISYIAIGLVSGVIAGLIIAPFTTKPEKLIFYKGKWTESKYAP